MRGGGGLDRLVGVTMREGGRVAKNIVFCADGTWNGPGEVDNQGRPDPTNVYKLFLRLAGEPAADGPRLDDEQEHSATGADGAVTQVCKYINGVGDSANPIMHLLGGTMGAGLIARIVRGYTFISRNYVKGDRISIVGFSRGAYTARALAGLIVGSGLLDATTYDPDDKVAAYRLGAAAWYAHQRAGHADGLLGAFEKFVEDLPGFLIKAAPTYVAGVPIQAVGVWDTVGSVGFIDVAAADGARVDLFPLVDADLDPSVAHGFHAISLDEQRHDFTPSLWNTRDGVVQRLFPGAHADVGGGYPVDESGLSDGALAWMEGCLGAEGVGVLFGGASPFVETADAAGVAHQPWRYVPWMALEAAARRFEGRLDIGVDGSVRERMKAGVVVADPGNAKGVPPREPLQEAYAPGNLP